MDSKEQRSALRAAVDRGDGPAVVHLLQGAGNYDDALQLAGEGLMAAVIQRVEGAPELVRHLVLALRQRGWDGDDDLASQLDAMLGTGPAPMLRPLPVDRDQLAGILEGDPLHGGGRIDLKTGEVWPQAAIEYARETGEEDEHAADDPSGGRRCTARGRGRHTGTWSCSSRLWTILAVPTAWPSRSKGAARSAGSRTYSLAGPANWSDGTHSPKSVSVAGLDRGSPKPATASGPPPAVIRMHEVPPTDEDRTSVRVRLDGHASQTRTGAQNGGSERVNVQLALIARAPRHTVPPGRKSSLA